MGIEVHRDRLTPMVRQSAGAAREAVDTALAKCETNAAKIACAISIMNVAANRIMAIQPNAEGYMLLSNIMSGLGEQYQGLAQTLPSKSEH